MTSERDSTISNEPRVLLVKGDLWALVKPAGMVVHPAGGQAAGTMDLTTWAVQVGGAPAGTSPIHRLDRGTSGLVLMSADPAMRASLGEAFASRRVHKEYRALVLGRAHAKGIVRRPLPDARRGRPLDAVTRYWRLEAFRRCTFLRVRPETGRKHQIRRHLAGIGHPVLGDRRHGGPKAAAPAGAPARLWLHCARLMIPEVSIDLRAPITPELKQHLEKLRPRIPQKTN